MDPLPLFYVGGQTVALEIVQQRATYVMLGAFDPGALLDLLETERATLDGGRPHRAPRAARRPVAPGPRPRRAAVGSSGGAVVPADLVRRVGTEIGASVTIVFGMTECSGFVSQTLLDDTPDDIAETIGPPLPGIETRVVDPQTGDDVAVGEVGELLVRGYNVMAGYHDQPAATTDAFAPGGWLRTGDLVTADARGYLRIIGRLKDLVVTGAENVYPAEVEAVLTSIRHRERGGHRPARRAMGRGRHRGDHPRTRCGRRPGRRSSSSPASASLGTRCPVGGSWSTTCRSPRRGRSRSTRSATSRRCRLKGCELER